MANSSQADKIARLSAAVVGLQTHFPNGHFVFKGTAYTTQSLVDLFQAAIAKLKAAIASRTASKDAVADARTTTKATMPVYRKVVGYVEMTLGSSATILAEFGEKKKEPKEPTAEVKAEAVKKRRETRAKKRPGASEPAPPAATGETPPPADPNGAKK